MTSRRKDDELDDEIRSHLAMAIRDRVDRGEAPAEAEAAARREFGNVALVKEVTRDMWGRVWLERCLQDLRYAGRMFVQNRAFTLVAILSLALGIGANTALFQVLDAVRLRSLPIPNPQKLLEVQISSMEGARGNFNTWHASVTNPIWEAIRDRQQAFSGVFAWGSEGFNLATGGPVRMIPGMWVSGSAFDVLGVRASIGRLLTQADDQRGCATPGAVISHAFWQREFGGSASAIGRTLRLNGHAVEIVGVTEPRFFGLEVGRSFDVAVPICAEPVIDGGGNGRGRLDSGTQWWLAVMGRVKPGSTRHDATAHLRAISGPLFRTTLPPNYPSVSVDKYLAFQLEAVPADSGISRLRENYEGPLWLLLGTAALVLLIACANLANLLLARASAREREIGVRLSLGAGRARIIRQLLTESLLLATLGAVLGIALAGVLSRSLVVFLNQEGDSIVLDLALDWRVLGFTVALAVLTCLLFGLAPALRGTRLDAASIMKGSTRGFTAGRERATARRALVVAQVALSLVLLIGALLFVRSLRNLQLVDPGFRSSGVVVASLDLRRLLLPPAARTQYKTELLQRLRSVPGIQVAAGVDVVPVSGSSWSNVVWLADDVERRRQVDAALNSITSRYFQTLGIPLLAGRDFDELRDTASSLDVAIVNEAFARATLAGRNPVGATLVVERTPNSPEQSFRIVGLVKDAKYADLREEIGPQVFLAASQDRRSGNGLRVVARSGLDPSTVTASLAREVASVSPDISLTFALLPAQIERTLVRERLMATLSGFFGALAAILATVGLYGVVAYAVARRTNEIGVRMALGASRHDVAGLILREAAVLLVFGVEAGLALALTLTRLTRTLLFGLQPHDPATLATAVAALAVITFCASYVPTRRAMNIEPTVALRTE
jgi:putative ABC transport system permease protein